MSSKSELEGQTAKYPKVQIGGTSQPPPAGDEAEEGRGGVSVQDIFSNLPPEMREEILKNLDFPDLLAASLVCKKWNTIYRETLRGSRGCLARIDGKCNFNHLKEFSALLETSACIPFSGLTIAIHPTLRDPCMGVDTNEVIETALKISSVFLKAAGVKYLSIRVDRMHDRFTRGCMSLPFARVILRESAGLLEELSFVSDCYMEGYGLHWKSLGIYDEGFFLPNLRRLNLPSNLYCLGHHHCEMTQDHSWVIQRTVITQINQRFQSISPKLEVWTGDMLICHLDFLLSRDLAWLVKECHILSSNRLDRMHQFALTGPKLLSLEFSKGFTGKPQVEKKQALGFEVLRLMLESSKKSLKTLKIGEADLGFIAFRWKNIPVLVNVEHLLLTVRQVISFWNERNPGLTMLNWGRHFPNLKQVCIDYTDIYTPRSEPFWDEMSHLPREYACESVTKLVFARPFFGGEGVITDCEPGALKKLFPNVKVCWMQQSWWNCVSLSRLWYAWPDLEEICIFGLSPFCGNHMKAIMGISEEEAAFLRKNMVDLESLEVVPAKPNILYFRKLRKLVIQFDHGDPPFSLRPLDDYVFLPPQVCSWMLSRMLELVMEVDTICRRLAGPTQRRNYCGLDANVEHLLEFGKAVRHDLRPYF